MKRLINAVGAYLKMLVSTPSDREFKLREFEEAERRMKYHTLAAAQHDNAANSWAKKYEKARSELSESIYTTLNNETPSCNLK